VDSVPLLSVLAWIVFLGGPRTILGMFLVASARQKERAQALGAALVMGILLNLILIPRYGPMGAALATVGTEAFLVVLMALRLWPLLGAPRVGSRFLMGGLATATFFALFKALPPQPMFVVVPSCIALYSIAMLCFPQIRREELQLVRGLLQARGERAQVGDQPL
jgi:O-antigen/teichoic acid export membrane protein